MWAATLQLSRVSITVLYMTPRHWWGVEPMVNVELCHSNLVSELNGYSIMLRELRYYAITVLKCYSITVLI